jgi:hypothetical protein
MAIWQGDLQNANEAINALIIPFFSLCFITSPVWVPFDIFDYLSPLLSDQSRFSNADQYFEIQILNLSE